jgi:hypothetical protein
MGNLFAGNDCGFYSVRGFAACLITLCFLIGLLIVLFVALVIATIQVFFTIFDMEEIEKNERDEDVEITFDKANKVNQLRDDFYSITFLGYVYR